MKICVIGLGYIGLPTACLFANAGYGVIGVDVNQETLKKLYQGKLPFEENGLEEILENALPNMSFKRKPEESDIFFLKYIKYIVSLVKRLKLFERKVFDKTFSQKF